MSPNNSSDSWCENVEIPNTELTQLGRPELATSTKMTIMDWMFVSLQILYVKALIPNMAAFVNRALKKR